MLTSFDEQYGLMDHCIWFSALIDAFVYNCSQSRCFHKGKQIIQIHFKTKSIITDILENQVVNYNNQGN